MKNSKGFTLVELMITSIIMVIIIGSVITFLLSGYSISNQIVAGGKTQNLLNVIQEKIYYTVRKAGSISNPDENTIEIFSNNILLSQPIFVFTEKDDDLVLLSGDGSIYPRKKTNLSAKADLISWDFSMSNKRVIFKCSIKGEEGDASYSIPETTLISYYRSSRPTAPLNAK